jgi:hypothetical protein
MTPLRTTRPAPVVPARPRGRWLVLGLAAAVTAAAAGCSSDGPAVGGGGAAVPVERLTAGAKLPPPEAEKIEYNPDTRTLTFYDLPDARWVVYHPGDRLPVPAGPEHRLPRGVDPDKTVVYYTREGGHRSESVTLRQIQDGRGLHASNILDK